MTTAQEVQGLFDRIAPVYDELNDRLSFGLHRVWKKMAIAWVNPHPQGQYLDLCCGSGDVALGLVRAGAGAVVGVDFSAALLAIAARRAQQLLPKERSRLRWCRADVLTVPFADGSVDGITLAYGLRNVVDRPRCLAEMARLLKPGAIAAVLDFHRPTGWLADWQRQYLATQVVPAARALGLEAEYTYLQPSIEGFPPGPAQETLARQAGFTSAVHYPLAGGLMGVLVARR
ncbi:MAG: bifunctional demethylmenaquinone methyltransferase/2-methoxy-6-polyprenyl-1,4-benzoquinol methylase UbiE [Pseudanabaenaceae cyanobacterium]